MQATMVAETGGQATTSAISLYQTTTKPNQETIMATASARHILVETEEACQDLKDQIEKGQDFGAIAAEFSSCPSGKSGGALGTFSPGQMVKEFDEVVFSGELGKVHGPVKTQFGYHLIEITQRVD
ncbi:peptidylprolyl isomerase [Rhodopirellula europaea]|uniref:peptidylprolyl isomerase n=1 Tax=Rhodopirellula europaea TaxID=1263866 RepID=UPI003D285BE2